MRKAEPFEAHTDRYERWFEEYEYAYRSELDAVGRLLPEGHGLEIGVGSGRFAGPLGIEIGIDPAGAMVERARERGVEVVRGVAEALPFVDDAFSFALLVTTICFVDDVDRTMGEARRVIESNGRLVVGYVDKESELGRIYQEHREENPFYREATFLSTTEVTAGMERAGFSDLEYVQTVFTTPGEMDAPDAVEPGYGDGSFVVVSGTA